jgi:hypothetical protein
VNLGKVQVEIGTVQDADLTKSGEILGQYKLIFCQKYLKFWTVQVKIGTVQDNFWDSTR